MKHRKKGRKFSRKRDQRQAFFRGLSRALFLKEKIITTEARAKEMKSFVEKFITKAKKDDLATRRDLRKCFSEDLVKRIVNEIAPRYKERNGGYTRIVRLGPRRGDAASMASIELVK